MIRRLWPLAAFCALSSLAVVGILEIVSQAGMNVVLVRLPEVPPLGRRNEVLQQKISGTDTRLRQTLSVKGATMDFGRAVGELGRLYQANQFYDQALSCYRLALDYDKESALWFYLSASIHQQRGETVSTIGSLEKTLSLSADYSPAVLRLADTYFKDGDMEKAKVHYERRLKLETGDAYALMGLARIALDEGDWAVAEANLRRAISSEPDFADAHRLLAHVHEHYGRFGEMEKSLERASQSTRFRPASDPWIDALSNLCFDTEQLLVLGSMALAALDIDSAVEKHFARALEIDPQNPSVHLALGKAYLMAGEWTLAHRHLTRTLELDATSDQAYFQLGLILQTQNKLREAETMMVKALSYQPDNANVLNNLGVILLRQEKFNESIKSFKAALDIYPEHINASYNLGLAIWAAGDSRGAVAQYRRVLEMKPEWAMAANSLAWVLATDSEKDIRNGKEALKWSRIALQDKNKTNPEYLDTLAAAYAENGQFEESIRVAEKAIYLANSAGDVKLSAAIEKRLRLYRAGSPYHE